LILLVAIAGGLFAGLLRAGMRGRQLTPPHFRLKWLVLAAFILQWLAFIWPVTRGLIPDRIAGATLILSQVMLFVFVLANACQPGLKALGLGLALNFLVIASNDGFMPISPETIQAALGAFWALWTATAAKNMIDLKNNSIDPDILKR